MVLFAGAVRCGRSSIDRRKCDCASICAIIDSCTAVHYRRDATSAATIVAAINTICTSVATSTTGSRIIPSFTSSAAAAASAALVACSLRVLVFRAPKALDRKVSVRPLHGMPRVRRSNHAVTSVLAFAASATLRITAVVTAVCFVSISFIFVTLFGARDADVAPTAVLATTTGLTPIAMLASTAVLAATATLTTATLTTAVLATATFTTAIITTATLATAIITNATLAATALATGPSDTTISAPTSPATTIATALRAAVNTSFTALTSFAAATVSATRATCYIFTAAGKVSRGPSARGRPE